MRHRRLGVVLAAGVFALSGCTELFRLAEGETPCDVRFSVDRCGAMAESAAERLGVPLDSIVFVTVLPDKEPPGARLGGPPVELRVQLDDGTSRVTTQFCVGISGMFLPPCMDQPAVRAASATAGGYRDVPCQDAGGGGCATALPEIEPEAAAAAVPIDVPKFDVPIDHVGVYEIPVADGSLPNGILTDASFRLVDDWPDDISIKDAVVFLEVRSLETGGRPFDNYYRHGWGEGVERVRAILVFDVTRFEPGAVLSIEDVVVR